LSGIGNSRFYDRRPTAFNHLRLLFLDLAPQFVRPLPNALLRHQFASHRGEHVIVFVEGLQAMVGELSFHGQRHEKLLAH
jgi:hypothetical protein